MKFHSKIDLSNAYEQIQIKPEDIHKTTFAMVFGMCESNVMQQGNCNRPTMFQHLMVKNFHDALGIQVHVYLNDIFIFSYTLKDHE